MTKASLDDLAAFATVARLGSFRAAATALETSPSNLSHTIRRLESRLGTRLLQRTSRSVSVSEAGAALLATLDPALRDIDGALDVLLDRQAKVSGIVRLTATRQAYDLLIRPMLPAFLAAHPDAAVEVVMDYAFRDIVADRFDAGLRLGDKVERDMVALRVGPDLRMVVVAAPSYLAQHGVPSHPHDLAHHRCINYRLTASGVIYAWEFEEAETPFTVQVSGPLIFNDPAMMLQSAIDGIGIAYLLEHEAQPHLSSGTLTAVLEEWTSPFSGFSLFFPSRRHPRPVFSAFVDHLRRPAHRH